MDNLKFIKIKDLNHSINFLKNFINFIEKNLIFISKVSGEPFLTRRKLISNVSASYKKQKNQDTILDVIDLCDGKNSLIEIKRKLNIKNNKLPGFATPQMFLGCSVLGLALQVGA